MEDTLCGSDTQLKLIETLFWDGHILRNLPLHMERMTKSACRLGWNSDAAQIALAVTSATPAYPARMRVTLDRAGYVEITHATITPTKPVWRVGMSPHRLRSSDPWLRVKSTRRALYDSQRAALSSALEEVIFANERDEICEGTITNLFFDKGQGLRTPPLSCGLLPGILRSTLLASGVCQEEVLLRADLHRCQLWVGNSLRGMIRARLE
ncbi:aminotransferase class IV family protein [Falsirhodobacter deserti]|uniref:aminotransferase class IV family protein n=1 Tax=Falsirhodobacter deserti TaxID=1365611 RepID=UPI001F4D77C8|nr:aminotransferase class IV family protein [Falsirhodobacter deserti]